VHRWHLGHNVARDEWICDASFDGFHKLLDGWWFFDKPSKAGNTACEWGHHLEVRAAEGTWLEWRCEHTPMLMVVVPGAAAAMAGAAVTMTEEAAGTAVVAVAAAGVRRFHSVMVASVL